jgi:NADPH-dependent glutamate synthase beta subunit-like oxidoreductase
VKVGGLNGSGSSDADQFVSIDSLRTAYDAVVLAYGASSDLPLKIPGEELRGVVGARSFVNWYNGHPDYAGMGDLFDLQNTKRVVIVGEFCMHKPVSYFYPQINC